MMADPRSYGIRTHVDEEREVEGRREGIAAFIDSLAELERVLDELQGGWRTGRFGEYVSVLRQPNWFADWCSDPKEIGTEALAQTYLLNASRRWWRDEIGHNRKVLLSKLHKVLRGDVLPATGSEPDPARENLFELLTLGSLRECGLDAHLHDPRPDLVAKVKLSSTQLGVECKRPSNVDRAMERALTAARDVVLEDRTGWRMNVVAIDTGRLSALRDGLCGQSEEELDAFVRAEALETANRVAGRLKENRLKLTPGIAGIWLISHRLFVSERLGRVYTPNAHHLMASSASLKPDKMVARRQKTLFELLRSKPYDPFPT